MLPSSVFTPIIFFVTTGSIDAHWNPQEWLAHIQVAPLPSLKTNKARSACWNSIMEETKAGNELSMEDLMGQLGNTSEYNELKKKVSKIEKSKVIASELATHT